MHSCKLPQRFECLHISEDLTSSAGITSAMRNKKATQKSGFSFFEHCRACTKQCSEMTKDAVQSTAFLLRIAEEPKGWALSGADHWVCVVANPAGITSAEKSASSTVGAKQKRGRVEFTQTSFSFCFVLPMAILALSMRLYTFNENIRTQQSGNLSKSTSNY